MKISKETLRGYLLEEVLAYLIRNAGYKLLVDKSQDPRELRTRGNGLVVVGRGGVHQADVLGQLEWIPAFTFPIRLFLEAKFRKDRTGIDVVRSAIGIIDDLNQNYSPIRESGILINRYTYNYAVFSTSGFSKDAVNMAIAHKISLIDLSDESFCDLRKSIDSCAQGIISEFGEGSEHSLTRGAAENVSRDSLIKQLRIFIRRELQTWPGEIEQPLQITESITNIFSSNTEDLFKVVKEYGELYIGMANGPFLLVLKASDNNAFKTFVGEQPKHEVTITWNKGVEERHTWIIKPVYENELSGYTLTFTLPDILAKLIFENINPEEQARNAKKKYLSSIYIYKSDRERDELYKLMYSETDTRIFVGQQNNR